MWIDIMECFLCMQPSEHSCQKCQLPYCSQEHFQIHFDPGTGYCYPFRVSENPQVRFLGKCTKAIRSKHKMILGRKMFSCRKRHQCAWYHFARKSRNFRTENSHDGTFVHGMSDARRRKIRLFEMSFDSLQWKLRKWTLPFSRMWNIYKLSEKRCWFWNVPTRYVSRSCCYWALVR